jgi:hypothetical protein
MTVACSSPTAAEKGLAMLGTRRHLGAGLLAIAVAGLGAGCASQAPAAPRPVPVVPPAADSTGLAATGERAISPAPGGRITSAQVRRYVRSHRIPQALTAASIAIESISFRTSSQISSLLHTAGLEVPAREPACLVLMTGTFRFSGPPGETPTFPVGVEVFDARTGNLLQAGGLPALPPAS